MSVSIFADQVIVDMEFQAKGHPVISENRETLPDLAYDDTGAADGGPEFPAEEACCCCWRSCCSFWKNMFLRASRRCCRLEGRLGSIVTSLLLSQHSFPVPEKSLSTPALLLWPHATSLFLETPSATASVSLSEIQVKSDYIYTTLRLHVLKG